MHGEVPPLQLGQAVPRYAALNKALVLMGTSLAGLLSRVTTCHKPIIRQRVSNYTLADYYKYITINYKLLNELL